MMSEMPVCKVLILDADPSYSNDIRDCCDKHKLTPLRVNVANLRNVLRSNIDLGAVIFAEGVGGNAEADHRIAKEIRSQRPELPIIRKRAKESIAGLDASDAELFCGEFSAGDSEALHELVETCIFNMEYPTALVKGIHEICRNVLQSLFSPFVISANTPCIVRDRLIFGELFSLIPLHSSWCRGYLMMQAEEETMSIFLRDYRSDYGQSDFRAVNSLLGEATNMIWGQFKAKFGGVGPGQVSSNPVEVPLLINHARRYISFGTENPQLCFPCNLADPNSGLTLAVHLRFVFNLNWMPEQFTESSDEVENMLGTGELEMF